MDHIPPQEFEPKLLPFKEAKESTRSCIPDTRIQRCLVQTEEDPDISSDRCIATFLRGAGVNEQVWIEWKQYEHTSIAVPAACVQEHES
jgi:hypothetical protein